MMVRFYNGQRDGRFVGQHCGQCADQRGDQRDGWRIFLSTVQHRAMRSLAGVLALVSLLTLAGCQSGGEKKEPEQLFSEVASGVVLIRCEFYHSCTLPSGDTYYFTGFDENGEIYNLTRDVADVQMNPNVQTGTGFFVDSKGDIMTNRHVVEVALDLLNAQDNIAASIAKVRQSYADSMRLAQQIYAQLEQQKNNLAVSVFLGYQQEADYNQVKGELDKVVSDYERYQHVYNRLPSVANPREIRVNTFAKYGIAYHDTYVTTGSDFFGVNECIVRKVSKELNTDLAIIQLKNKRTPESAYIFDITGKVNKEKEPKSIADYFNRFVKAEAATEKADPDPLKMGQKLYVIGYNSGLVLATTRDGIKAQMTEGKIAQIPDGERILYNISIIGGSSGSPVLDEDGCLRGVNFAKIIEGADLGFAVPMNLVRRFLME